MSEKTLIRLSTALINTSYIRPEDIAELLQHGVMTDDYDEYLEGLTEICREIRDLRFEQLDSGKCLDDGDLEKYAKILTRNIEHYTHKFESR